MLLSTIQHVIADPGFQVKSTAAATALKTAQFMSWSTCPDNKNEIQQFSNKLATELEKIWNSWDFKLSDQAR